MNHMRVKMKVHTTILILLFNCFLVVPACIHAEEPAAPSARNQDLKALVEMMYLNPQYEPLFNMFIAEAMATTQKTVDADDIIQKFRDRFSKDDELISKFTVHYADYSDAEVHELRQIFENPVFRKYIEQTSYKTTLADIETVKNLFADLVNQYGTAKKIDETSSKPSVIEVTSENFQKEVTESKKPVIIDFYASACSPCRWMEPIFEELSCTYQDKIHFVKINCDTQGELMQRYEVISLPTFLFIKPGEEKVFLTSPGFTSKKDFQAKITAFLESCQK